MSRREWVCLLFFCWMSAECVVPAEADRAGEQGEAPDGPPGMIVVHRDEPFYREHPSPEQGFAGTLIYVDAPTGPDTRNLPYHLQPDGGGESTIPLYLTGKRTQSLQSWIGRRVLIRGKRIDQSAHGLPDEIWVATIEPG